MSKSLSTILISRKFWAIVLPLLVLAICRFFPSFSLDAGAATGLIIVVAGYILSVALDPGANAGTWLGVFASRKFWAAAVGLTVMIMDGFGIKWPIPISPDNLIEFAVLLAVYSGGVAIEGIRKPPGINQSGAIYANPEQVHEV